MLVSLSRNFPLQLFFAHAQAQASKSTNSSSRGNVNIEVEVKEETLTVALNAADLEVFTASFKTADGSVIESSKIELDTEREWVIYTFAKSLPIGKGTLTTSFKGFLNDQMKYNERILLSSSFHQS